MKYFMGLVCAFILSFAHAGVGLETGKLTEIVKSAVSVVDGIEPGHTEDLSFTVLSKFDEYVISESYDPKRPPEKRWALDSVDGRAPTDIHVVQYKQRKDGEMEKIKAGQAEGKKWLAWYIDMNTLQLESDSDTELRVSFAPLLKDFDKAEQKKLRGELLINKVDGYVKKVTVVNAEPLSPNFLMKATLWKQEYFMQRLQDGHYALKKMISKFKGRQLFVDVEHTIIPEYSNYSFV